MAKTRWLDLDEQRAWRAYLDATRLLADALDRQLQRDAGLSLADYEILVRLSEAPDRRMRMSDLADATLYSRSRLSHAVARLEGEGWVARSSCPTDKRGTLAELTPAGFSKLKAAAPGHVTAVRQYLFDQLQPGQADDLHAFADAIRGHLCDRLRSDRKAQEHGEDESLAPSSGRRVRSSNREC